MAGRVIAVMNQKGGVGKTTTAINLGAALAEIGEPTLVVDLDPQANLTRGLGLTSADVTRSTYDVMTDPERKLADVVIETKWPELFLAPSHIDLSGAEIEMVSMYGREMRLARAMGGLAERFAYILIDCQPSLSLLTVNAVAASREILVPMQAHPFALEGLGKLFEVYDIVRREINPEVELTGVLVTMFDRRTNVSREVVRQMLAHPRLAGHIFATVVGQNIRVAESQGAGAPVVHFARTCPAALAYRALAAELRAAPPGAPLAGPQIDMRERAAPEPEPEPIGGEGTPQAQPAPGPPVAEPQAAEDVPEAERE